MSQERGVDILDANHADGLFVLVVGDELVLLSQVSDDCGKGEFEGFAGCRAIHGDNLGASREEQARQGFQTLNDFAVALDAESAVGWDTGHMA